MKIIKEEINIALPSTQEKNIFLIGFMGAGKSAVSLLLGQMLDRNIIELDAVIQEQVGMPITEVFAQKGEASFRKMEQAAIKNLENTEPAVISCGGGAVLLQENVESMKKSGKVVLLTARPETILERVSDSTERPLLTGHMNIGHIQELMEKRSKAYGTAADIIIQTDGKRLPEICEEIMKKLAEMEEKHG